MINTKLVLIIAAAIAVIVAGYFAIWAPEAPPTTPAAINPSPSAPSAPPSPQYLHDHPAELADAKAKCGQGTAPSQLYCYNVEKAEELVAADEYSKAVGGGAKPK